MIVRLKPSLINSQVWKSIFRNPFPSSEKDEHLASRNNLFLHLHPVVLGKNKLKISHTWCMGGISFLLFIVLSITGILLMFYYRPTVEHAYHDMKDLEFGVTFGLFMRNLHRWTAHGMVLTVIAHMTRVFYVGAYRPPREFNWIIGVLLLILTLLLSFTGYLLPWDQLAYWAITVGTSMAKAAPVIGSEGPFRLLDAGSDLGFLILGGRTVGQGALLRFYVWHVIGLPFIMAILLALHFWRTRKDGRLRQVL
ncbi:MAG: cytochrome b N-terminal domain-containing protein [Candidatus Tectomicrobia bacterium]|uniref:Cytochrome b N-terminal domain-containing protein n=1 Tax=Tectimicrobiota bacterium TaxID=2528274 RepID=A0A933GN36_UNCTE|nr:cytochrome b N-terminal domain-containing protein [Candidatus Tectomicrobia bacterium]